MDQERRQVIIKEIEHWRRSRLLPDQYCDFLLNLYTDSEVKKESNHALALGQAIGVLQRATGKQWLLTFGFFTLISFVVLYFNAFPLLLQIGISLAAVAALIWRGQLLRNRHEAAGLAVIGTAMLLLLGSGFYLLQLHGYTSWQWTTGLLASCSLFWIIYGAMTRIHALHICGWLGEVLVYGWLLYHFTGEASWYQIQLYWLPVASLFGWGSWFIHRWSKSISAVLFITCAIVWFMPEVYSLLFVKQIDWIQLQILAKIGVGGALLFSMRKKWMVWFA